MKSCPNCKKQYKPIDGKPIAKYCSICGVALVDVSEAVPVKAPLRAEPVRAPLQAEPVRAPLPAEPIRAPLPISNNSTLNETPTMFADVASSVARPVTPTSQSRQMSPAELDASASPTMFHQGSQPVAASKPSLQVRAPNRTVLPASRPQVPQADPAATTLQPEESKPALRFPTLASRLSPAASTPSVAKVDPLASKVSASLGVPAVPIRSENSQLPLAESAQEVPAVVVSVTGGRCAKCGTPMPQGFFFCGLCGFDMRTYNPDAAVSSASPMPPIVPQGPVPEIVLLTPDGKEHARHKLVHGRFVLGRSEQASLPCLENAFLSLEHAEFTWDGTQLLLQDLGSFNGIYRKLREATELQSGDNLCIGQQFFRFEQHEIVPSPSMDTQGTYRYGAPLPPLTGARLVLVGMGGSEFDVFYLRENETKLGRENSHITFSQDTFISRAHAKISVRDGVYYLEDLGSSNGTFLRIRETFTVADNDLLLMGDQLFRIELPTS